MGGIITDGRNADTRNTGSAGSIQDHVSFRSEALLPALVSCFPRQLQRTVMKRPALSLFRQLLPAIALFASTGLDAQDMQELRPFHVNYEAHYGNLEADAERSLEFDEPSQLWQLGSLIQLQLLGTTVTEIEETSRFRWQDNLPLPVNYLFQQRGIGSRVRSLEFIGGDKVNFAVNGERGTLPLVEPAYDDLNSFLVLREQLRRGLTDITFTVVDRNELKEYRYQVKGEETLQTPAGTFKAVHVTRIREEGNARTTDLWLATQHDYLLLKLVQDEPDGDTIMLELEDGTLEGKPLKGE